ncbi:MAG: molybdenum cofactor guanylyltransferase [Planctomycetes bacterium]|nr:molybdenum cofactor guanylyltransferase [Planctomycetota bacterium]
MRFGGVVLCGGKSSRMGYPKAWLPFGEEFMLQRVARILRGVVSPVTAVAAPGQDAPPLPSDVSVVYDRRESRGPLEGLLAGLTAVSGRCDAVYASSCDAPRLVPAFVQRMTVLLRKHQIVVPCEGEFCHPLAAVYRLDVIPHIESLLAADRLRPAFLFELADTRRVPVDELRTVDPELRTLANLNHPRDYAAALAAEGLQPPADLMQRLAR